MFKFFVFLFLSFLFVRSFEHHPSKRQSFFSYIFVVVILLSSQWMNKKTPSLTKQVEKRIPSQTEEIPISDNKVLLPLQIEGIKCETVLQFYNWRIKWAGGIWMNEFKNNNNNKTFHSNYEMRARARERKKNRQRRKSSIKCVNIDTLFRRKIFTSLASKIALLGIRKFPSKFTFEKKKQNKKNVIFRFSHSHFIRKWENMNIEVKNLNANKINGNKCK